MLCSSSVDIAMSVTVDADPTTSAAALPLLLPLLPFHHCYFWL
jgi:hypothetical protein